MMSNNAGVWIDHRNAVIVTLGLAGEQMTLIASDVEKQPRRAGDSPLKGAFEARQVAPDDRRQMALTAELDGYYDSVIAAVHDAEALFIFGPGEAKGELEKRLGKKRFGGRIAAVEAADKMTDRQVAARVRLTPGRPDRARPRPR
jgi:hypothetical protein